MTALHPVNASVPAVDARAVSKFFGGTAVLHDITFTVNRGERALILGDPASGKTTLLKVLAGHVTPSGGRVRISGVDARTSRLALNDRVGFVGQYGGHAARSLNLMDMLRFSGRSRPLTHEFLEQRINAVVSLCELDEAAAAPQITDGLRVRTALALAVLHAPDVLLLDGCLTGVEEPEYRALVRILDRLEDARMTVLVSARPEMRRRLPAARTFELLRGRLGPGERASTRLRDGR